MQTRIRKDLAIVVLILFATVQIASPALVIAQEAETPVETVAEATPPEETPVSEDAPVVEEAQASEDTSTDETALEEDSAEETPAGEVEGEAVPESASSTPEEVTEEAALEEVATSTEEVVEEAALEEVATSTEETLESALPEESSGTSLIAEEISSTTASSTQEGPVIVSGDAVAAANILNIVNTNLVNSSGSVFFSNFFDLFSGLLDFRGMGSATGTCSLLSCSGGVQINLLNDAYIRNLIDISASSGGNLIDGGGDATIATGNAYAGLNLVNVVNANFVDSNYLLVTLNAFKGVNGDIVFPNLTNFLQSLAGASAPQSIQVVNDAVIENDVEIDANSGDNEAQGEEANVATGDAHASGNVFNQINTTLSGGTTVSILFRVHGSWVGEIFGAPPGLTWTTGDDGSIYLFQTATTGSGGGTSLMGTSTALIQNDVSVMALTGENEIRNADSALISTGDAFAGVNLVNIANANIIGRNWLLAIINIFGDFNGNIAFGMPDLWVGEQVAVPHLVQNEEVLKYTFTVINNGDAEALDVRLRDAYAEQYLELVDSSAEYSIEDGHLVWKLGDLPPGMATEVWYRATIAHAPRSTDITNVVTVAGRQADNNPADNTDTATVHTYDGPPSGSGGGGGGTSTLSPSPLALASASSAPQPPVALSVERTSTSTLLQNGATVARQEIVIRNLENRIAPYVVLRDLLKDPSGKLLQDERWDLGVMMPYEEVVVSYDITFGDGAQPGIYTLDSIVTGDGGIQINQYGNGQIELVRAAPALMQVSKPTVKDIIPLPVRRSVQKEEPVEEALAPVIEIERGDLSAAVAQSGASFPYQVYLLIVASLGLGFVLMRRLSVAGV